jgi:hypothetical protein
MNSKFKVVACNPSNEGKTYVWKLVIETKATVFGIEKNVKRTFYIGGMPASVEIGKEFTEDLSKFTVTERPFEQPETGEVIMLKWLHVKVA